MPENAAPEAASTLAVAYAFTPYSDTSAVVAAKRIRLAGRPVDLIQNAMDEIRGTDPTSDLICAPLLRRRAVLPTRTKFGAWGSIVEFCEAGLTQIDPSAFPRAQAVDASAPRPVPARGLFAWRTGAKSRRLRLTSWLRSGAPCNGRPPSAARGWNWTARAGSASHGAEWPWP